MMQLGGEWMDDENWIITHGFCGTPGAEKVPTYGVQITTSDGVWSWPDVDTDPCVVQVLVDRLQAARPEPCHYADIVLDFIEEYAAAEL